MVLEHELWRHALEHVRGQNVELAEIQAATARRGYVRYKQHPGRITTREVLQREWEIVCMARDGIRRCAPAVLRTLDPAMPTWIASNAKPSNASCSRAILSPCFAAGPAPARATRCGKCTALCDRAGRTVTVVAPQRQQVMDMERDGFQGAQTVSAVSRSRLAASRWRAAG